MEKSIEYGARKPKSDFDKRANDKNSPGGVSYVKGKLLGKKEAPAKQTKGIGKA